MDLLGAIILEFYIQDPTYPHSYSFHEAIIQECREAQRGAGTFAFVTAGGVRLLLEDNEFIQLFLNGDFKLIVGLDEITSERALIKVAELESAYDNFSAYAFLHNTRGSLFHPKFIWFKKNTGGVLIIGSNNLTEKGLRRNREAFSVINLDEFEIITIENNWNDWLAHNNNFLRPVNDNLVLSKARLNARIYSSIRERIELDIESEDTEQEERASQPIIQIEPEDLDAWYYLYEDAVLIAEIPGGGSRWKQANFNKESFVDFFGAQPGNNAHRILLRNVLADGSLANVEVRQSVSVASHNWRFELGAASGSYPTDGRPIGVFVRVSARMFLYILAMPTDTFYSNIREFLDRKLPSSQGMKRYRTTVEELIAECPNLPIWQTTTM